MERVRVVRAGTVLWKRAHSISKFTSYSSMSFYLQRDVDTLRLPIPNGWWSCSDTSDVFLCRAEPHYGWADAVGNSGQLLSIVALERPPGIYPDLDLGMNKEQQ